MEIQLQEHADIRVSVFEYLRVPGIGLDVQGDTEEWITSSFPVELAA